jgi:hypothetical protein
MLPVVPIRRDKASSAVAPSYKEGAEPVPKGATQPSQAKNAKVAEGGLSNSSTDSTKPLLRQSLKISKALGKHHVLVQQATTGAVVEEEGDDSDSPSGEDCSMIQAALSSSRPRYQGWSSKHGLTPTLQQLQEEKARRTKQLEIKQRIDAETADAEFGQGEEIDTFGETMSLDSSASVSAHQLLSFSRLCTTKS